MMSPDSKNKAKIAEKLKKMDQAKMQSPKTRRGTKMRSVGYANNKLPGSKRNLSNNFLMTRLNTIKSDGGCDSDVGNSQME